MRSRSLFVLHVVAYAVGAALLLGLSLAPSAFSQPRRGGGMIRPKPPRPEKPAKAEKTPIDEFQTMSPQERQKALDRMPPAQRKKLEERLQKFNELPAEQQRTLKNMYNRLNELPPGRQDAVRKSMNQFSEQPVERRQAMRQELKSIGELPEQDRETRLKSPEFRSKFSHKEQDILRNMAELLPPG
jgi:ribonuclease E